MDKVRTLLADDHALVRAGIHNALNGMAILEIVGEVGDGLALMEALETMRPQLLLIDITMPHFEPISAIREIRQQYASMKILVVSAYDDDVYVQGLLGVGVDGYHLKDQSLSDLRLAVERVVAGEKWVSSRLVNKLVRFNDNEPPQRKTMTLTPRQGDILRLLQDGLDNQTIARRMKLSIKTVENHLTRLYRQLDVQSRLEAVNYVRQYPEVLGAQSPAVQSAPHLIEPPLDNQITILLIDDNQRYRHQLRRMVTKACINALIYEADDIEKAVELTEGISPQLAFVDVVLGDEDGIYCTRRIKSLVPQLRVVLISAYPDREFHRRGIEAGAVAFLDKKDIDVASIRQVIDDAVK